MNKFLLSALLCSTVIFSGIANANEHQKPFHHDVKQLQAHHETMARQMAEELELTEEQRNIAEQIREKGREDVRPLMEEMSQLREKIDNMRKQNMEQFEQILTDEQKEKFEKIKERERKPRHQMMRGMHKSLQKMPKEK